MFAKRREEKENNVADCDRSWDDECGESHEKTTAWITWLWTCYVAMNVLKWCSEARQQGGCRRFHVSGRIARQWCVVLVAAGWLVVRANGNDFGMRGHALDKLWAMRRRQEVDLVVGINLFKEWAKPTIGKAREVMNCETKEEKAEAHKKLGRAINLCSNLQELIMHWLMYKSK